MAPSVKGLGGVFGIHHITAIARNPQRNLNFHAGILGLRLVKKTVNFDDPMTYHLYYGDSIGRPGTILTFFPWSDAPSGYPGTSQVTSISFLVPTGSLEYWTDRFARNNISFTGPSKRFDEELLSFHDPDGLNLELISSFSSFSSLNEQRRQPQLSSSSSEDYLWDESSVAPEHAIRGFHSATLSEEGYERTSALLTDTLGFKLIAKDDKAGRFRFATRMDDYGNMQRAPSSIGSVVDIICQPDITEGFVGIGSVHHIAWRVADDKHQVELRKKILNEAGLNPTPVIDRKYFHSVYFREPGGILFEIATDPPGFTVDERPEELGKQLMLPEWLESLRARLEKALPPIKLPRKADVAEGTKGSAA